jgi:hypothetical protein
VARLASGVALAVLVSAVLLSTLTNRLYNLQPNGLFAVHSAVSLVWVGVALGAVRVRPAVAWRSWAVPAAISLAVLAVIPDLDSGAPIAVWLRVARAPVVLMPTLVVCVVALARRRPLREHLGPSLGASVALMLAVQAWMVAEEVPAVDRAWRHASSDAPSTETAVASWLRTRTPPETVLGTNHLCATPACPQPEYSGDAAFAVAVGRRFVVAAPLFALPYSAESGTWRGRDRVATSIEFGRAPTMELAAALREAGVGWFVAERARSGAVDWAAVGDVRFENADYVVIELRDP